MTNLNTEILPLYSIPYPSPKEAILTVVDQPETDNNLLVLHKCALHISPDKAVEKLISATQFDVRCVALRVCIKGTEEIRGCELDFRDCP
jgi:hypothetical protein